MMTKILGTLIAGAVVGMVIGALMILERIFLCRF